MLCKRCDLLLCMSFVVWVSWVSEHFSYLLSPLCHTPKTLLTAQFYAIRLIMAARATGAHYYILQKPYTRTWLRKNPLTQWTCWGWLFCLFVRYQIMQNHHLPSAIQCSRLQAKHRMTCTMWKILSATFYHYDTDAHTHWVGNWHLRQKWNRKFFFIEISTLFDRNHPNWDETIASDYMVFDEIFLIFFFFYLAAKAFSSMILFAKENENKDAYPLRKLIETFSWRTIFFFFIS